MNGTRLASGLWSPGARAALLPVVLFLSCTPDAPPLARSAPPGEARPWDPDSAALVLTAMVDGQAELFLLRHPADTAWVRLTHAPGLDNSASWSADGRRLVYHSTGPDPVPPGAPPPLDVYGLEPEAGTPPVRLTDAPGFDYLPMYSPDGSRVAFLSRRAEPDWPDGSPGHIYVADAAGADPRRVTRLPVAASLGASWLPDGESLLIARRIRPDGPTTVLRVHLDFDAPPGEPVGSREEVLVEDSLFKYTPVASPDGSRIAWSSDVDGGARVTILELASGVAREISAEGYHYVDEWTPDGRWVLVTRWDPDSGRREPWLLSAGGSEPHRRLLPEGAPSAGEAAFRPGGSS